MSEKVRIEVEWDGDDVELKLISAIMQLHEVAEKQGLSPDGATRVAEFITSRFRETIDHRTIGG